MKLTPEVDQNYLFQYHESRVPVMTSDDVGASAQRESSSEGRKEECATLTRLREMGVSFVNKEDLIDNSKRSVEKKELKLCQSSYHCVEKQSLKTKYLTLKKTETELHRIRRLKSIFLIAQ